MLVFMVYSNLPMSYLGLKRILNMAERLKTVVEIMLLASKTTAVLSWLQSE